MFFFNNNIIITILLLLYMFFPLRPFSATRWTNTIVLRKFVLIWNINSEIFWINIFNFFVYLTSVSNWNKLSTNVTREIWRFVTQELFDTFHCNIISMNPTVIWNLLTELILVELEYIYKLKKLRSAKNIFWLKTIETSVKMRTRKNIAMLHEDAWLK